MRRGYKCHHKNSDQSRFLGNHPPTPPINLNINLSPALTITLTGKGRVGGTLLRYLDHVLGNHTALYLADLHRSSSPELCV